MRGQAWIWAIVLALGAASTSQAERPPFYRVLDSWGQQDVAAAERYTLEVNPNVPARTAAEGIVHALKGEFAQAQLKLGKVRDVVGKRHALIRNLYAWSCALNGNFATAREALGDEDSWRYLRMSVLGPFRDNYPLAAPLMEHVTAEGHYRIVTDVNLPMPIATLERKLQAAEPAARKALIERIRREHTAPRELGEIMEKAFANFERMFGKLRRVNGIATVYMLADRKGFKAFYDSLGKNPEHAAGTYFPRTRSLAFYDKEGDRGRRETGLCVGPSTLDTMLHELWHQYLHLCMNRTPRWINEGFAVYFGQRLSRELIQQRNPDSTPHYPRRLKHMARVREKDPGTAQPLPVLELMNLSPREFYGDDGPQKSTNYAHAWAVIDFLASSAKGRAMLVSYLEGWAEGRTQAELAFDLAGNPRQQKGLERAWRQHLGRQHKHFLEQDPRAKLWFTLRRTSAMLEADTAKR